MASLSELEIPSAANGPTVCERNSRLLTSSTTSSVSTAQIIILRFFVVVAFEAFMFYLVNIIADTKENVKAAEINELKITLSQWLNI